MEDQQLIDSLKPYMNMISLNKMNVNEFRRKFELAFLESMDRIIHPYEREEIVHKFFNER